MEFRLPSNTALVLFTRTRDEEARYKDFTSVNRLHTNSLIAHYLISHAEQTARASGLPCFIISSELQHGKNFGERLAHAFEDVYRFGYDNVIAIGNDCPTLTPADLIQAAVDLETHGAVMGPADDGGVYLIGMQKAEYNPAIFASLPWSSSGVHQALISYFIEFNISYTDTGIKSDIDDEASLSHILRSALLPTTLRSILQSILASLNTYLDSININPIRSSIRISSGLRAPPAI